MSFAWITLPFIILTIIFFIYLIANHRFWWFIKWVFVAAFIIVCWPIGLALACVKVFK